MTAELASYASNWQHSRGRLFVEEESSIRSPYQRDRDRVVHSTAFRRLKHKTQVFVAHEGDHYRTRLTHSIEVAQIARTIARILRADEDLTECLALAHDLGHTPFGHAGERALNDCMAEFGGFDHNDQTLRIVTHLERKYAGFDGLNLTWESLEGLVKHNGPLLNDVDGQITSGATSDIPAHITTYCATHDLALGQFASLEAQIAAIADDIAYNAHDMDDGLRAKLFEIDEFRDVPIAGEALALVVAQYPDLDASRVVHETVRRLISAMVDDVIGETQSRIAKLNITSPQNIRLAGEAVVQFSPQMTKANKVLQEFLNRRMYNHAIIRQMTERAQRIINNLFAAYMADPTLISSPPTDDATNVRMICDYIAGMSDLYALDQHRALFDLDPLFR